ncbi:MAG TPA: alkylmercury lyase family protein [Streptosporangiaceae bacterium]
MRMGRNRVRVVGRRPPAEAGLRAVQQQVLRSFAATGHAPSAADLAETAARYGTTTAAVLAALQAGDYLQLGPDGRIRAAYPFSGVSTPHLVDIDGGPRVHAMCAIDALGMAAMLGTGVTITSADPGTGQVVTVTVRADGKAAWRPATAVVFNGRLISAGACGPIPDAPAGPASAGAGSPNPGAPTGPASADACCGYMNFFGTRASAAAWGAGHPEVTGEILGQGAALRLGIDIFGQSLEGRSDGPDR